MTIEKACEITGIRMHELSRVSLTALSKIIRAEKLRPESDYVLCKYTKTEYVEAYETILNNAKEENNMSKDYYKQIDTAIRSYEEYKPYHQLTIDQITDKIDWCWKWKKITEGQMEELVNRIIKVMEDN